MEKNFPSYLEEIIKTYVKQSFLTGSSKEGAAQKPFNSKDLALFSEGAKELSDLFTENRSELKLNYLNDKRFRSGYLIYFLPLNFFKIKTILEKLPPLTFEKNRLKILDLGCGPGTASLAALETYLSHMKEKGKKGVIEIEIVCLDQNYHTLKDAQTLIEEVVKKYKAEGLLIKLSLQVRTFDLRRGKPDTLLKNNQYDLILVANFLNEWTHSSVEEKHRFIEKIYQRHLEKLGYFILVDPAFQKSTRELMELRDLIVKKKALHIYGPCLHVKNCPMLASGDRDWCHFYFSWKEPDLIKKLDKLTGNKNEFLKAAYLILSSHTQNEAEAAKLKDISSIYRNVSNIMGSKGKAELVICGPAGRWHLTRLDKNSSPKNKLFSQLKRGDLIRYSKLDPKVFELDGKAEILKEDIVERILAES